MTFGVNQANTTLGQECDESSEFSGYSINIRSELSLDIPTPDQSTSRYRATLG